MSKVSDAKRVFRLIDDTLEQIKISPRGEILRIADSLQKLNEEICDKFIELLTEKNEVLSTD